MTSPVVIPVIYKDYSRNIPDAIKTLRKIYLKQKGVDKEIAHLSHKTIEEAFQNFPKLNPLEKNVLFLFRDEIDKEPRLKEQFSSLTKELEKTPQEITYYRKIPSPAPDGKFFYQLTLLFIQDYLIPSTPLLDVHFQKILQKNMKDQKGELKKLSKALFLPGKTVLDNASKGFFLKILKTAHQLISDLKLAQKLWLESNKSLPEKEFFLNVLNFKRQERRLPPLFTKGIQEDEIRAQIFKFTQSIVSKYVDPSSTTSPIILSLVETCIAAFLHHLIKGENIDFILTRLIDSPIFMKSIPDEEIYVTEDATFSKAIGTLLVEIAKNFSSIVEPLGRTKTSVEFALSLMESYKEAMGKKIYRELELMFQTPNRYQLAIVLSHLFWIQTHENWHPYLFDRILKQKALERTNLEETFADWIYQQIENVLKKPAIQNKKVQEIIGKIATKAFEVGTNPKPYTKELSTTLFRWLHQKEILYMILFTFIEQLLPLKQEEKEGTK